MNSNEENLTVRERFRHEVNRFMQIERADLRQDLEDYQKLVASNLRGFMFIQNIVDSLSLFSSNEELKEINTSYLPFIAISFYESCLTMKLLADLSNGGFLYEKNDMLQFKAKNLENAKLMLAKFLQDLESFGSILSKKQSIILNTFQNTADPSVEEISGLLRNPVSRRAEKIANFKVERELRQRLELLDEYYLKSEEDVEEEDLFKSLDEEVVRTIFVDQLKYFALKAFENLELIALEMQVLDNRPLFERQKLQRDRVPKEDESNDLGYTTRLETNPNRPKRISDILTKQGKILQPFTITNNKQELRRQVFGTGQVLPSMTVEEYLDYELSHGKMLKGESSQQVYTSDDDDSDAELEKRNWDDWKDDNPKGSGNIKGNIG